MNLSQYDTLIQAVLDGDASAAQRAELDRLLTSDAALRAKFESLQHVCTVLDALPDVDPPAGMVESILSRATLRGSRQAAAQQRLSGEGVVAKDASRAQCTKRSWFSEMVHLLKEIGMNEQKPGFLGTTRGKFLVTAGIAAVALAGLSTVIDFPPGGSNTAGTIVPAERHRAPQNSADDIKVGSPDAAPTNQAVGAVATDAANSAAGQANRTFQGSATGDAAANAAGQANRTFQGSATGDAAANAAGQANRTFQGTAAATANAAAANHLNAAADSHLNAAASYHLNAAADSHLNAAASSHLNAAASSHLNAAASSHLNAAAADAAANSAASLRLSGRQQ